ncbi:hypothetical protein FISHEDRAFT_69724 [Fistulina hepatica ATCC 64428]|uniref:Uncharacterized protein n=1 Tax=Fistulina hepatica ATCC 64428 TaxID=1128425 RepID=A0A0D7AP69_9AGAR|nr:hypothetical protein FISHEDRAFT_69724 [Fistulina hepatica ATCC 64428]
MSLSLPSYLNITLSPDEIATIEAAVSYWQQLSHVSIVFLEIHTSFITVLFSMLITLVFFSTKTLRCAPIFIFNVILILFGIAGGGLMIRLEVASLIHPLSTPNPSVASATAAFIGFTPNFVGMVLAYCLYVVYPPECMPKIKFFFIVGVPCLICMARLANEIYCQVLFNREIRSWLNGTVYTENEHGMDAVFSILEKNMGVEWSLQMINNL